MLALTAGQVAALASRQVKRRMFIYCEALGLDGVTPAPAGFWDDVGNVTIDGKVYYGSGNVIQVSSLSAKSDMTIPGLSVVISGIAAEAATLVRGSTLAQRPITVSIGIYDTAANTILGSLVQRFVGVVDAVEVHTPEVGGTCNITLTCESISRALTIKRTETRSKSSLEARSATDSFYNYTAGQAKQAVYFGRSAPGAVSKGPAR